MAKSRIEREKETVSAMIRMYCAGRHGERGLCQGCKELLDYTFLRLDACRFSERKPTCAKCVAHCYKAEMKERIKEVMRYSGPRIMARHPITAISHLAKGLRKPLAM